MPLTFTLAKPMRSAGLLGWAVQMEHENGTQVTVLVPDSVLEDLKYPPEATEERLGEFQAELERAASTKYDRGELTSEGLIHLTAKDLGLSSEA